MGHGSCMLYTRATVLCALDMCAPSFFNEAYPINCDSKYIDLLALLYFGNIDSLSVYIVSGHNDYFPQVSS